MKKVLLLLVCMVQVLAFSANAQRFAGDNEDEEYDDRVFFYDEFGWRLSGGIGTVFFNDWDVNYEFKADLSNVPGMGDDFPGAILAIPGRSSLMLKEQTFPPLISVKLEHKPYVGLASDLEVTYFQHDLEGNLMPDASSALLGIDDSLAIYNILGDVKTLLVSLGASHYLDNRSSFTPYLAIDVGLSSNSVGLNLSVNEDQNAILPPHNISFTKFAPFAQAGGGFDFRVGSLNLGLAYSYLIQNGYDHTQDALLVPPANPDGSTNNVSIPFEETFEFKRRNGHRLELKVGLAKSIF